MTIIAAESQTHSEFKAIVTITDDETKIEFTGGENISPERLGMVLYAVFNGRFHSQVVEGLEAWGEKSSISTERVTRMVQSWANMHDFHSEDDKPVPCVHPLSVFSNINSMPQGVSE